MTRQFRVWKSRSGMWFLMDYITRPLWHAAFGTFEELQDFLNNPGRRHCYL